MDAGNNIRETMQNGAAIAWLGVREIMQQKSRDVAGAQSGGRCFILNSLKHKAEVDFLRKLYNRSFFVISIYSPLSERIDLLKKKIGRGQGRSLTKDDHKYRAMELIRRDQNEPENKFGQNLRDAYCQADFFAKADKDQAKQLQRFLSLLFGDPTITPSIDEHAMFQARAASLRSADLSRQVGATIVTKRGQLISVGCNEVPRAGGGHFWAGTDPDDEDDRDFRLGVDPNVTLIREMLDEIIKVQIDAGWIKKGIQDQKTSEELAKELLSPSSAKNLKEKRAGSIIEFGRIVHAEMSALTDVARRGVPIQDCTLVCTTFPCHMCARHIIAAGVDDVVYIEPYPKSLTPNLYEKSAEIEESEASSGGKKVVFRSFIGVSPNRYLELFSYRRGKDDAGNAIEWKADAKMPPRVFEPLKTIPQAEAMIVASLVSEETKALLASKQRNRPKERPKIRTGKPTKKSQ